MDRILKKLFEESAHVLFIQELESILNDVAERNLCGRLAIYISNNLEKYGIKGYYADPEYNRMQDGRVKTILDGEMNEVTIQCDLILHSRGQNIAQDNLIAIEMSKSTKSEADKDSDRKRLRALTKSSYDDVWSVDGKALPEYVCGYLLGVFFEINRLKRTALIEYYQKGLMVSKSSFPF